MKSENICVRRERRVSSRLRSEALRSMRWPAKRLSRTSATPRSVSVRGVEVVAGLLECHGDGFIAKFAVIESEHDRAKIATERPVEREQIGYVGEHTAARIQG